MGAPVAPALPGGTVGAVESAPSLGRRSTIVTTSAVSASAPPAVTTARFAFTWTSLTRDQGVEHRSPSGTVVAFDSAPNRSWHGVSPTGAWRKKPFCTHAHSHDPPTEAELPPVGCRVHHAVIPATSMTLV